MENDSAQKSKVKPKSLHTEDTKEKQHGLEGNGAFFDGMEQNIMWWNGVECCGIEWNGV